MPAADIWFGHRRCWQKRIASKDGNAALVAIRATRDRWEVSAQLETDTKPRQWLDYCEYRGGALDQEYKAKRRATMLGRKLLKD